MSLALGSWPKKHSYVGHCSFYDAGQEHNEQKHTVLLQLHSAPAHWTLPHILLDKLCHVAKHIANGVRKHALPIGKLQHGHGIIKKTAIYINCTGNLLKEILCKLLIWIWNFDETPCDKKMWKQLQGRHQYDEFPWKAKNFVFENDNSRARESCQSMQFL